MQAIGVFAAALITALGLGGGSAWAALGQPVDWQLGLQDAGTPVMEDIVWFHDYLLLGIITAIALFVLVLLIIIMVRFNATRNPTPSRTTHNTLIEVLWTAIPVLILVVIAIPSFKLLFYQLNLPPADVTVKATGNQWFWSYTYPDNGNFEFNSILVPTDKLKPGQLRLLTVDNEMVVPVNKVVRVQTIGADVIHSFAVPSFGIKIEFGSRPAQRDLVQGDARRRLLWPVLRAVRSRPCVHADRGQGGERAGIQRLGRGRQEEICRCSDHDPGRGDGAVTPPGCAQR